MSNTPLSPNYKKDVGRLVTDRYDFQEHIEGIAFRHKANQIDLEPILTIGSIVCENVQDAIDQLTIIVTPPVIADATTSSKGIIQLTGDIAGTATHIVVTKIQGRSISTLPPNSGDVLTWDGGTSSWMASAAVNAFSAGGDLSGTNSLQQVIGLTGTAGSTRISSNALTWTSGSTPVVTQTTTALTDGADLTIRAQNSTGASKNGGDVIVTGGSPGASGLKGGVSLKLDAGNSTMLEVTEIASSRRVLSLLHNGPLTTIDMPANTGDLVMYVRDASTPPTIGNPSNGTIVYSSGGELWIKQQDGNNFPVGSIPNPSIWGSTGQQSYTYRSYVTSSVGAAALAFSLPLPSNTSIKIDATFTAKATSATDGAGFNLSMGYLRGVGSPVAIGTVTNADPRTTTGAAATWTIPNIITSGDTLQVLTGYSSTNTINWLVIIQLTISQG
jgi:hypothetical protein